MQLQIYSLLFGVILLHRIVVLESQSVTPKNFYKIWKEQQEIQKNLTLTQEALNEATTSGDVNYDDYLIDEKSTENSNGDYDESDLMYEQTKAKTTTTTTTTIQAEYEDESYDDLDEAKASKSNIDQSLKLKKQCPSICHCSHYPNYNKNEKRMRRKASKDYSGEEEYSVSSTTHGAEYEYQYEENIEENLSSLETKTYEIHVDCSHKNLNSISNLFDYDFPLEQIVSFNLSNNKFKYVRLDDGFEDLINLRVLDLSSNSLLKYISPRNFLKKFRHLEKIYLNNLNQINCNTNLPKKFHNNINQIDCKWYRALIYLHKRNISVIINEPLYCDIESLAQSPSTMSRCFNLIKNDHDTSLVEETHIRNVSTKHSLNGDSRFDFKIEPELNQVLIEGDTLELTCRLRKLDDSNGDNQSGKKRVHSSQFYKSSIKWYLNDRHHLTASTIYYDKDSPTQIQIFETKNRFGSYEIFESKLVVSNTVSAQNSGKYRCVATAFRNENLNSEMLTLNTTWIDIKILNKIELKNIDSINKKEKSLKNKNTLYCSEIVTQTYKGVYKWPKTFASNKLTQKCSTNNTNFVVFECKSNGEWSNSIDLSQCDFKSNLTNYLYKLMGQKKSSLINLEEFIHNLVSIQSSDNISMNANISNLLKKPKTDINMYDISYIQRYLISNLNSNKSVNLQSKSWRHQFIWLNDMLSRLNEFYLRKASHVIDAKSFSSYFFDCLLSIVTNVNNLTSSINEDYEDYYYDYVDYLSLNKSEKFVLQEEENGLLLSTYLAAYTIYSKINLVNYKTDTNYTSLVDRLSKGKLVCDLDKHRSTKQIYFKCHETTLANDVFKHAHHTSIKTKIETESNLVNYHLKTLNKMVFLIIENDNLFPSWSSATSNQLNSSSNDMINMVDYSLLMKNEDNQIEENDVNTNKNRTCAQIFGLIQPILNKTSINTKNPLITQRQSLLNLTLEIKMPLNFYSYLHKIESKLVNKIKMNESLNGKMPPRISLVPSLKETNLFDQIFSIREEIDATYEPEDDLVAFLDDEEKLKTFRKNLIEKWLNVKNYEIVYGTSASHSNLKYIEWSNRALIFKRKVALSLISTCFLKDLATNFRLNQSLDSNKYRIFARINCLVVDGTNNIASNHSRHSFRSIQFVSLRQRNLNIKSELSVFNNQYNELFNKYAHVFDFDLDISDSFFNLKIFSRLFWKNYETFHFKIVYFSAIASSLLLFASILVYSIFSSRLLMPRSFFHVYINIWVCVLLLIVVYTFGIYQVNLPHLCLSTAVLLHYLTLCASVWYTLYFYCLYKKLHTLRKQNFNLIFNKDAGMNAFGKNDFSPNQIGGQEYVKKSVIHLYMLGWGMPSLLCSIIVSITKRDYIQVPFGYCFSNEKHILIGSVFVPVLILLVVKMVFAVLIWITLKKILVDLKEDKEESENSDDNENQKAGMTVEELNDKVELCKKWAQAKQCGSVNGLETIETKVNNTTTKSITLHVNPIDDDSKSYASSFDNCGTSVSNNSDQTSIMDAQYKPHIQLKFSCFCLFIFMLVWLSATCLACSTRISLLSHLIIKNEYLAMKIFSYFFSIFLFVYSMLQFSFYVLSRDEFSCINMRINYPKWFESCSIFKVSNSEIKGRSLSNHDLDQQEQFHKQNHWYFEPPNESANVEEKTPLNQNNSIDCSTKHYRIYEAASVVNSKNEKFSENKFLSKSNNQTQSLVEESSSDELNQVDDEHKVSICDVIFSAKKSPPIKQSFNTNEYIRNRNESNSDSLSNSNINTENVQMGEFSSSEESKDLEANFSNHATLAVQEDLTEYLSSSSQIISKLEDLTPKNPFTNVTESVNHQQNFSMPPKKTNHIRNSSLSSTNQSLQIINGASQQLIQNKKENDMSQNCSATLSKTGTLSKKPVYVYVDHKYEEKIYDKLIKTTTVQSAKSVELEHTQAKIETKSRPYSSTSIKINRPNKLEDLFNNSCSANTGTAIDSIGDLIPNSAKTSLSSTIQTLSSSLTRNSTNLNTNAYASSSITGSDSIGSSHVSSNNSSSNLNNICKNEESQYQLLSYEDRIKYQNYLANVNRSSQMINNSSINNFKVSNTKRTIAVNSTKQSFDNSILRNSLIRPKELESKHETSV